VVCPCGGGSSAGVWLKGQGELAVAEPTSRCKAVYMASHPDSCCLIAHASMRKQQCSDVLLLNPAASVLLYVPPQRGVQLVATAHGNELQNLVKNPALSDLIGGIQSVTLGERRRGLLLSVFLCCSTALNVAGLSSHVLAVSQSIDQSALGAQSMQTAYSTCTATGFSVLMNQRLWCTLHRTCIKRKG
jgi:hypothetical protein